MVSKKVQKMLERRELLLQQKPVSGILTIEGAKFILQNLPHTKKP